RSRPRKSRARRPGFTFSSVAWFHAATPCAPPPSRADSSWAWAAADWFLDRASAFSSSGVGGRTLNTSHQAFRVSSRRSLGRRRPGWAWALTDRRSSCPRPQALAARIIACVGEPEPKRLFTPGLFFADHPYINRSVSVGERT